MRQAGPGRWPGPGLPALLLPTLLSACTPEPQAPPKAPPLNLLGPPPDVVIFAVSGRCGPPCEAPRDNWDYLAARGTVDALADTIARAGYRVEVASYAANALDSFTSRKMNTGQRGYAALLHDFTAMKAAWFGRPPPAPPAPRIVLLGHSHGSVWLHQLVRVNQYVPFALQIDLDGNCASWSLDHARNIALAKIDQPGETPATSACQRLGVGGNTTDGGSATSRLNTAKMIEAKDIVWPNVQRDLEVQSKRLPARDSRPDGFYVNYLFDLQDNLRPDGSQTGIERFRSTREDHSTISYPSSDAMKWVLQKTAAIVAGWRIEDEQRPAQEP